MGNPYFMFWPYGGTAVVRNDIDMLEPISDLQQTPHRLVEDSMSLSGHTMRTNLTSGLSVRIVDERFTSREKWRKLSRLINHLETGRSCGFAVDVSNAWGSTVVAAPRNSTTLTVAKDNWFESWTTGGASLIPAVGDEIVLESGAWRGLREYFEIDSISVTATTRILTLDHAIRGEYNDSGLVRNSDFFPLLRLPKNAVGGNLLNHDHRISYNLEMPLELVNTVADIVSDNENDGSSITGTDEGTGQDPDGYFYEKDKEGHTGLNTALIVSSGVG